MCLWRYRPHPCANSRWLYHVLSVHRCRCRLYDGIHSKSQECFSYHVRQCCQDLVDGDMGKYLEENGYIHEKSTPEAHYQNFVGRYVNIISRATAVLLHGQHFLQAKHWDWAILILRIEPQTRSADHSLRMR